MVLQAGLEVHAEDGGEASTEREPEHAHLDVQAHSDDPGSKKLLFLFWFNQSLIASNEPSSCFYEFAFNKLFKIRSS